MCEVQTEKIRSDGKYSACRGLPSDAEGYPE